MPHSTETLHHAPAGCPAENVDPLTIVHVVAPAPFGGLERVVQALATGQAMRGHRAHVLAVMAPDREEHPFLAALCGAGVDVTPIAVPDRAYRAERRLVADFYRRVGADIVHTHGYRPDVLDSGVAPALGIPRVSTTHGFTGGNWKGQLYEWLQRRALRRFDAVIAVARPQVQRLMDAGVPPGRIHLVPNAWQERETLPRPEARTALGVDPAAFHLGWVGRLSREKGADLLLEAVAHLGDLPMVVSMVGDGRERAALEARAAQLGISGRVRWHGSLPDAGRYFAGFDLFALSSRTEGTPMVLFEAMAARTPIVATAVGGVPDVISPEEGVLVPSGDPEALVAALRAVFADRGEAAVRAARARMRLEADFALPGWLTRHDAIYRQVIHSRAR